MHVAVLLRQFRLKRQRDVNLARINAAQLATAQVDKRLPFETFRHAQAIVRISRFKSCTPSSLSLPCLTVLWMVSLIAHVYKMGDHTASAIVEIYRNVRV